MDIRPVLQSLGVKTLMLDHISPGLDIDQAVQQVRLIVAEEGTVAAALTEVGATERRPTTRADPSSSSSTTPTSCASWTWPRGRS